MSPELRLAQELLRLTAATRILGLDVREELLYRKDVRVKYGDAGTIRITVGAREYDFALTDLIALARLAKVTLSPEDANRLASKKRRPPSTDTAAHKRVLKAFHEHGSLTDADLSKVLKTHGSHVRSRRAELSAAGLLKSIGRIPPSRKGGRSQTLWRLAEQ